MQSEQGELLPLDPEALGRAVGLYPAPQHFERVDHDIADPMDFFLRDSLANQVLIGIF